MESTYAATLAANSFRTVMAIAAHFDLEIHQLDVVAAFLHACRDGLDEVNCELPEGFKEEGKCGVLLKLGLKPSAEEPCLFTSSEPGVMVLYVDDILIVYPKEQSGRFQEIKQGIQAVYEVKDQGEAQWFLGMRILRDREKRTITLVHNSYIEKVAHKFGLTDNPHLLPYTPMLQQDLVPFEE